MKQAQFNDAAQKMAAALSAVDNARKLYAEALEEMNGGDNRREEAKRIMEETDGIFFDQLRNLIGHRLGLIDGLKELKLI